MSNEEIVIAIFFITIGMFIFNLILNRILGFKQKEMKDLREKALDLQERVKNAQMIGDPKLMRELQLEMNLLMKSMLKKQVIPLSIRCIIFWIIFAILGIIFSNYSSGLLPFPLLFLGDGWVAIYFLFSLGLGLIVIVLTRAYKKITGKDEKIDMLSKELMTNLSASTNSDLTNSVNTGFETKSLQAIPPQSVKTIEEKETSKKSISWKDRIHQD